MRHMGLISVWLQGDVSVKTAWGGAEATAIESRRGHVSL